MATPFVVVCPHCGEQTLIEAVNCGIFRHAVLKENMEQINPHTPQNACEGLLQSKKVYGCAKPFRLRKEGNEYKAEICGYI